MSGDKATHSSSNLRLAYIIGTYPSLTTTFIDREISVLRQLGVQLQTVSIRRPSSKLSPEQDRLQKEVVYLLPVSLPAFLTSHLRFALRQPRAYFGTFAYLLTRPHPTMKSRVMTLLHFAEGGYTAYLLRHSRCDHIHAHFVDRAAIVALVASRLLNVSYSVTAHANDIYVDPVLLPEKLSNASFVATCTGFNKDHLTRVGNGDVSHKLDCIYHGLDVNQYQPGPAAQPGRPLLLSVGQLKEKKGYAHLIKACRILKDQGYDLECQIVGEGPLREALEVQVRQLSLEDTVMLCGALPHAEVVEKYRQATLFVLPCVLGANGDRDGIPNVILEAMAMQLPIVSTQHSGIPEAVEDGANGWLVPPADETALADALAKLLIDTDCRHRFGQRGRQIIVEQFNVEWNVRKLVLRFAHG